MDKNSEENQTKDQTKGFIAFPNIRWRTVYGIVVVVGVVLGAVLASIQLYDRFREYFSEKRQPSLVQVIMQEVEIPNSDAAIIERLTENFISTNTNPQREDIVQYINAKKAAISTVRISLIRYPLKNSLQARQLEAALNEGHVDRVGELVNGVSEDNEAQSTLTEQSSSDLLTRAQISILIDDPIGAAEFFDGEALRVAERDLRRAEQIRIDGADQLGNLGCQFGREWLDSSVTLYEITLQNLTLEEYPMEWTVAQNNLGVSFLGLAIGEEDNGSSIRILYRSLAAFENASKNPSFETFVSDPRRSIIYSNMAYTLSELFRLGEKDADLFQKQAVAQRYVYNNEDLALQTGRDEALKWLEANSVSMQIKPQWDPTLAQPRGTGEQSDPCQRYVINARQ